MGVVIEIFANHPGGRTRNRGADMSYCVKLMRTEGIIRARGYNMPSPGAG
jgi:hypothetical protein